MFSLREAFVFVLEPPSVPGIGTGGGLKGYVQDRAARGLPALEGATWALAGAAGQTPGLDPGLHAVQHASTPQIWADIDRTKAEQLGVPIAACSRRCRSTWARPTSTTSTSSAAPIA